MSREWGRESYAGDWPSRKPVGIILALVVAEGTVKNHVSSILSKMDVRDRTRAVLKAIERDLI